MPPAAAVPSGSGRRVARLAVLGDSTAVGIGDPAPGGGWRGFPTLLRDALSYPSAPAELVNLSRTGARMVSVRDEQLPAALAGRPDVTVVCVGMNDTLRSDFDPAASFADCAAIAGALRAAGSHVLLLRYHDHSRIFWLPGPLRRALRERIDALNTAIDAVAGDDAVLTDAVPADAALADASLADAVPADAALAEAALAEAVPADAGLTDVVPTGVGGMDAAAAVALDVAGSAAIDGAVIDGAALGGGVFGGAAVGGAAVGGAGDGPGAGNGGGGAAATTGRGGIGVLDLHLLPGGYDRGAWSVDRLHPSELGHRLLAAGMAELLVGAGFAVPNPVSLRCGGGRRVTAAHRAAWLVLKGAPWLVRRGRDLGPVIAQGMLGGLRAG